MGEGSTSNASNAMERLTSVYNEVTTVGVDVVQVLLEPVSMHFFPHNRRNGDLSKTFLLLFAHHGFQTLVAPRHQNPRPAIAVYAASVSQRGNLEDQFARRDSSTNNGALVERDAATVPPVVSPSGPLDVAQLANAESLGVLGVPPPSIGAISPSAFDGLTGAILLKEPPNGESSDDDSDSNSGSNIDSQSNQKTSSFDETNMKENYKGKPTGKSDTDQNEGKKARSGKYSCLSETHTSTSQINTPSSLPR